MTLAKPQKLCNRHQQKYNHGHYVKVKPSECERCIKESKGVSWAYDLFEGLDGK